METDHHFVEPVVKPENAQSSTQPNTVLPEPLTHLSPPDSVYFLDQLKNGAIVEQLCLKRCRVTIGRSRDCDVVLDHPSISRYHSVLLWTPQHQQQYINGENRESFWYLVDCGSIHGTVCNKEPVIAGKMIKLIPNNNVFKFGGSTRLFTLRSNDTTVDDEDEDDNDIVEQSVDAQSEQTKPTNQEIGCNWGIDDSEAVGDNEETADSKALQAIICAMKDTKNDNNPTLNENAYSANPQKSIQHWFEREGYEIDYKVDSIHNKFKCTLELPIDGQWIPVEGSLMHKKKESIADTCLKCCQLLDRAQLLFPWQQQSAKNRHNKRANGSDSDSDSDLIDETVQNVRKKAKNGNSVASFDSLNESWTKVSQDLQQLKSQLVSIELDRNRDTPGVKESEDPLDDYMASIGKQKYGLTMSDKLEKSRIKMRIKLLESEQTKLEKLMKLAKPLSFATITTTTSSQKQITEIDSNKITGETIEDKTSQSVESVVTAYSTIDSSSECASNESDDKVMVNEKQTISDDDVSKQANTELSESSDTEKLSTSEVTKSAKVVSFKQPVVKPNSRPKPSVKAQSIITAIENEKKSQSKQKSSYDGDFVDWVPPNDQCGDGKTHLNSKYGY